MTIQRLYVFCEGQTEETFANIVLQPFFISAGVAVIPLLLPNKKGATRRINKGGWLDYAKARSFISGIMADQHSDETWFTTMLDLYAIPSDFPGLASAPATPALRRVQSLETSFANDIVTNDLWRFTAHLQLHEFETLLLCDTEKLKPTFPDRTNEIDELANSIAGLAFEEINAGKATAPSKRIIKFIPEYDGQKTSAGPIICDRIGLPHIRTCCPHFDSWLSELDTKIRTH